MYCSRRALGLSGGLLATLFLLAPATSFAQKRTPSLGGVSGGGGGATSRRDAILSREADIENRELNLRILREPGKAKAPVLSPEDRKLIVSQIFEDFERIQIVNREMMHVSTNLNTVAYKQMSTLAEEMNKRAKRLKTNLGIPGFDHVKREPEKHPEIDDAQLKISLQTLNASVKSFVANPLFQDPRVTDVRHLENLRRDIANLIDLSRGIKKAAGRLTHN